MATLNECVKSYVSSKRFCPSVKERQTAENLLTKLLDHPSLKPARDKDTFDPESFQLAVKETVSAYSNSKDSAIGILKNFVSLVNSKTNTDVSGIDWPPIQVSSTFERLMFISKYLQDPKHKVEELQELLWISDRTLEADLAKLRGNDDDPVQICGRKFVIEDTKRSDGAVLFKSTVHPLFLTYNLTQVIVILEGLKNQAEDPFLSGYALNAACDIWEQLSDYGKERIRFVLKNLIPTNMDWYDKLTQMQYADRNRFSSEALCSQTEGYHSMLECLKNELPVYIEYNGENGIEFFEEAQVLRWKDRTFTISSKGTKYVLGQDRILRSAVKKEMLL